VSACRGWRGIASARRAIARLDPASESPLESRSRGWFLEAGIVGLEVGVPIAVGGHTYWADFCAPTHRLIGQADGWSKYGEDLGQVRRSLAAEKERQAALESDGWRVVRWTGDDARQSVVARMRTALRGTAGQPPATAGMTLIFAPSGVGVARPSVNLTSSSST